MSSITICLTNWARPSSLNNVISSLQEQTVDVTIFLWNNGNKFTHPKIDWMVESSRNLICLPRWFMAVNALTEFVCILDDDLILKDEYILSDMIRIAEECDESTILGPSGVQFSINTSYENSTHLYSYKCTTQRNFKCDMIKGSMMFMRTDSLKRFLHLPLVDDNICDDIIVSSLMSSRIRHHLCLTGFGNRFSSVGNDEVALWRKSDHYLRRNKAYKKYFPHYSVVKSDKNA